MGRGSTVVGQPGWEATAAAVGCGCAVKGLASVATMGRGHDLTSGFLFLFFVIYVYAIWFFVIFALDSISSLLPLS